MTTAIPHTPLTVQRFADTAEPEARHVLEEVMSGTGLRPKAWQCYRSLWYYRFADEELLPRA